MSAQRLIDEFTHAGIKLSAENGKIAFEGPSEVLTPDRIDELRRHKAELLAALTLPDRDAFEKRSAIIEHGGGLSRKDAETLAAQELGFAGPDDLHGAEVARWAGEIDQLTRLRATSPEGADALERAQAFIRDGWALQAIRLGWDEVRLFGVCPRAPWRRLDRKGAAFGGAVQAVTQEAIAYVGGHRRYRAQVNNDNGAVPIWELTGDMGK